jgi:predicted metal-dependent enzyme (double-stranded beta helix superfamily)
MLGYPFPECAMSSLETLIPGTTGTRRAAAIRQFLADARDIIGRAEVDRATLDALSVRLSQLASSRLLFPPSDFPPAQASNADTSVRYQISEGDKGITLYLNSLLPGKTTLPHNHTTWAVIAAIKGEELNRVYRRTDQGEDPGYAKLELDKEVIVRPGVTIAFLPDDIHSIHVEGSEPTLHLHLYGQPLETLTDRIGIEAHTGKIVRYNKTLAPSTRAA